MQLEIRPEYGNSGIRHLYEKGYLDHGQDIIPNDLFLKIITFNNSYLPYARIGEKSKLLFNIELYNLDVIGYNLKIETELYLKTEVLYFSEALLEYLYETPNLKNYPSVKINWWLKFKKGMLIKQINYDKYGFFQ